MKGRKVEAGGGRGWQWCKQEEEQGEVAPVASELATSLIFLENPRSSQQQHVISDEPCPSSAPLPLLLALSVLAGPAPRTVPRRQQTGSALAHCQAGKQAELGEGRVHP